MPNRKRIFICALDWGLGHAARSLAIVRYLREQNYEVHVGGGEKVLKVFENEFPDLVQHTLPKVSPVYTRKKAWLVPFLILQIPYLFFQVIKEYFRIKRLAKEFSFDIIISDTRFGAFGTNVPSFYITNQPRVVLPRRFKIFSNFFTRMHQWLIAKYDYCLISDEVPPLNLGGYMTDVKLKSPSEHIGIITRLDVLEGNTQKDYLLCILSSQEPQRTMLEDSLMKQIKYIDKRVTFVRGLPLHAPRLNVDVPENCEIIQYVSAKKISQLLTEAELVICRPGFGSLLDLAALGKKALLIPTPGQSEQEQTAAHVKNRGWFYSVEQAGLDLKKAIEDAKKYSPPVYKTNRGLKRIQELIEQHI